MTSQNASTLPQQAVSTCLWFDQQALEAANFYVSLFPNSRILDIKYFLEGGPGVAGSVMTVLFSLNGSEYMTLNGGPHFSFSPATSLVAYCDSQPELDQLWQKLLEDGGKESHCGWLTDRFGVTWQVVPRAMLPLMSSNDQAAAQRMIAAMLKMVKLDMNVLQKAYDDR
ncbi:MAG: VOC family protein [Burkholderiales bacterium]|nr:VOC family protein [Burkholderiales bacterium]